MPDHTYFEELAALLAGGHLSAEELLEFRQHALSCAECRQSEADFGEIVCSGLPLTQSTVREHYDQLKYKPLKGARERFFQQAEREGFRFSAQVGGEISKPGRPIGFALAIAGVSALATAIIFFAVYPRFFHSSTSQVTSSAQPQLEQLKRENSDLKARLSQSQQEHPSDSQEQELKSLREQLQAAVKAAEVNAQTSDQLRSQAEREGERNTQLLADSENQQKLLADAKGELARLSQQRNEDQATTVAMKVRVNELSEQLRVATANLDLDHQLLAQGKDVRDLMGARQLHVVDVRDTDATGKPGKAFGRVFLTEGKSLIFYAFDLNETKLADAKHTFQVWGQEEGKPASARSLGFLYVDDKAQRRWALKVENPRVISEIDSVFVTVEPPGGGKKPSGPRMLYAYLGEANHP